jgi:hypothetical protein
MEYEGQRCESNKGPSLFGVGEVEQQVKIWNSRIACLAVASHPLHQENRSAGYG